MVCRRFPSKYSGGYLACCVVGIYPDLKELGGGVDY